MLLGNNWYFHKTHTGRIGSCVDRRIGVLDVSIFRMIYFSIFSVGELNTESTFHIFQWDNRGEGGGVASDAARNGQETGWSWEAEEGTGTRGIQTDRREWDTNGDGEGVQGGLNGERISMKYHEYHESTSSNRSLLRKMQFFALHYKWINDWNNTKHLPELYIHSYTHSNPSALADKGRVNKHW